MQTEAKNILEGVESETKKKKKEKEKEVINNSLKPHKEVCEGTAMYIETHTILTLRKEQKQNWLFVV